MNKVIILYGLPGSGKTTFAKQYCKEHPNTLCLNRDSIREMFKCSWNKELESIVRHTEYSTLYNALEMGFDVILDDVSNLKPETQTIINNTINEVKSKFNCSVEKEEYFFNVPLKECIKRDSLRENPVGARVIIDLHRNLQPILCANVNKKQLHLLQNQPINQNPYDHAIIVDIDNTISWNTTGRPWYGEGAAEGMKNDIAIWPIIDIINNYSGVRIFLTGRDDDPEIKQATMEWLEKNVGLRATDKVIFRTHGDTRSGKEIKEELYLQNIQGKYFIDYALEDSKDIADMYRSYGLIVLQSYDTSYNND